MEKNNIENQLGKSLDQIIEEKTFSKDHKKTSTGKSSAKYEKNWLNCGIGKSIREGGFRIFVGNLSFTTSWQNLKDHMRKAGEVSYADVFRSKDGKSKGCGIVEYATIAEAKKAIKELHDTKLDGRLISVREDTKDEGKGSKFPSKSNSFNPRERYNRFRNSRSRSRERDRGFKKYDREDIKERQLFIQNLPFSLTWQELKDLFREYGEVERANIPTDNMGRSKGIGFVLFRTRKDAQNAMNEMEDAIIDGRTIGIKFDNVGYIE